MTEFTENVIRVMKQIPAGSVASYGHIASLAGNKRGARGVVYILRAKSAGENLPWHRIVNKSGQIALKESQWFLRQKELLEKEGVEVSENGQIDLKKYGWQSL